MRTSVIVRVPMAGALGLALVLALSGLVRAEEETAEPASDVTLKPRRAIALSMSEAVRRTLQNSMDIKIDRIAPLSSAADIDRAEARFDWSFVGAYSKSRSKTPSASSLTGARASESDSDTVEVGFRKDLVTGGTIQPTLSWNRSESNSAFATLNPSYTTDAYIQISQPLLRNAGATVNLSEVRVARNNADIARYTFKSNVISTLADMQTTYWDLVFAIEDLDVKKGSLRLTKDTLEQTEAQVEAGLLAPIEITRVRADVASKEEAILNAQKSVEDNEDKIRRYVIDKTKADELVHDVGVVPLERAAYEPVALDLAHEVSQALHYRPDYRSARLGVKNAEIDLAVAKNAKLPEVDLSATLSMNGLGGSTSDSFDTLKTNRFHDWSGSVSVEIPIGNRSARASYLQARLARAQADLELENLRHEIIIYVKRAVREVITNLKRIRSTRLARELAEERLRAEEEKFKVGTALILDVLEAQTLLAEAESNERQAIVDYNKSLISLEQIKGTLLERNRIFLSGELAAPGY